MYRSDNYELMHNHACNFTGEALTIYTAKRGLRVALIEYNTEQREGEAAVVEGSAGGVRAPVRLGTLEGPTRLAVQAVLDAGSSGGSGARQSHACMHVCMCSGSMFCVPFNMCLCGSGCLCAF